MKCGAGENSTCMARQGDECMEQFLTDTPSCQSRVPITNGDRMRARSDEDLAKELTKNPPIPCRICEYWNNELSYCGAPNGFSCVVAYAEALTLDWLHQPAEKCET